MTRRARRWTEEELRQVIRPPLRPGAAPVIHVDPCMSSERHQQLLEQLKTDPVAFAMLYPDAAQPTSEHAALIDRQRKKAEREKLERAFAWHLESLEVLHHFEQHARFHPTRKWELDFLARDFHVGIELHGAVHANGRHTRGTGFVEDRRKMNAAAEQGITVLEYTPEDITTGNAACQVLRLLEQRGFRRVA